MLFHTVALTALLAATSASAGGGKSGGGGGGWGGGNKGGGGGWGGGNKGGSGGWGGGDKGGGGGGGWGGGDKGGGGGGGWGGGDKGGGGGGGGGGNNGGGTVGWTGSSSYSWSSWYFTKWGTAQGVWDSSPDNGNNNCNGGFFCWANNQQVCSAPQFCTSPPQGVTCPNDWWWHTQANCCVPRWNNQECVCPQGSVFEGLGAQGRCVPDSKCAPDEFWWDAGGRCCPNNWWQSRCDNGACTTKVCPENYYHVVVGGDVQCWPQTGGCGDPRCPPGSFWNPVTCCCESGGGGGYPPAGPNSKKWGKH